MIATGILQAMDTLNITIPVVARIQGTNGSLGMQMVSLHRPSLMNSCKIRVSKTYIRKKTSIALLKELSKLARKILANMQ
jgi:succinyl-CoA synthetase beta subunit